MASSARIIKKPHILCVGVATVDFVANVDHFPRPDEKMRSASLLIEGGGNAANTACAIGRLSSYSHASLLTAIGDDVHGKTILDGLMANHVAVHHVERFSGCSPFSYIICTQGIRTCIHQPSTGELSVEFATGISLSNFTALHFDGRYPAAAVALSRKCIQENIPYSVDVERPREGLEELLAGATIVMCNNHYVDKVLHVPDSTDPVRRLRQVLQMQAPNAKLAIQTMGKDGSFLIQCPMEEEDDGIVLLKDGHDGNIPIVTKERDALFCTAFGGCNTVDTTGAGDAFQGGFLTAYWSYCAAHDGILLLPPKKNMVLAHALRIASRIAAKKVEQPGARRGLPFGTHDAFIQSEMNAMLRL